MLMAKVSFAALCCFIAQAVRCAQPEGDTVQGVPTVEVQSTAGHRTLLQEMLLFSKMFDLAPFNGKAVTPKPTSTQSVSQSTRVGKIRAELTMLKSVIDTQNGVLNAQSTVNVPNYKGLNRYLFVKGLLNSMALKFEALKEFLLTSTDAAPEDIKKKLVDLKFGGEGDVIDDLSLLELRSFYKLFYDGDAPISNLRKHFSDYEGKLSSKDALSDTANPLSAFFTDNGEKGDVLDQQDKASADMIIYTSRPGNLPFSVPGKVAPRAPYHNVVADPLRHPERQGDRNLETVNSNVEPGSSGSSLEGELRTDESVDLKEPKENEGSDDEQKNETDENEEQTNGKTTETETNVRVENTVTTVKDPQTIPSLSDVADGSRLSALPVQEDASGDPRAAAPTSQTSVTSLRTETAEATTKKASSAFESFVTMLLVISAVFAL